MSGATILIVEDSETQALALRGMLEAHGYAVEVATSGEAALERLNDHLPDLVVADFHLPGMDGRELSRQIRLNNRTRALPLLMLTSAREQDLERQGLESGVDAYVPKSGDTDLLLVRLQSLLRRAAAAAAPADAPTNAQGGFRRARILLTNPSLTTRLRLRRMLEQEGYEVLEPADAETVLQMADRSVDGIVLPLIGPDLEGLELCERLRAQREALPADFQIMAIGPGAEEPEKLARAFGAGADEVASRDDGEDVLRVRIRALMRRKMIIEDNRRAQEAQARAAAADELAAANRQLREAQAQLIQSAKMASLGELVAGIAHEINNPLAFILGHQDTVERLVRETAATRSAGEPPDPMLKKALDRLASMRLGLQRIQGLVLNLRKFSRLDEADRQRLDAADAIDTVLALLSPKLGGIEVRRQYEARGALEGSPALLNQVVMNIVSNAADALGGAGVIAVATSDAGGTYRITIDDSGPGVPSDLRDRIFEPFFTTKGVGEGTGLGLAIAYSVVRAHDGDIAVDASPELGGARFTLTLPQRDA